MINSRIESKEAKKEAKIEASGFFLGLDQVDAAQPVIKRAQQSDEKNDYALQRGKNVLTILNRDTGKITQHELPKLEVKIFNNKTNREETHQLPIPSEGTVLLCVTPEYILVSGHNQYIAALKMLQKCNDLVKGTLLLKKDTLELLHGIPDFSVQAFHAVLSNGKQIVCDLDSQLRMLTIENNQIMMSERIEVSPDFIPGKLKQASKLHKFENETLIAAVAMEDDQFVVAKVGSRHSELKKPEMFFGNASGCTSFEALFLYRWKKDKNNNFVCEHEEAVFFTHPIYMPQQQGNLTLTKLQGDNFLVEMLLSADGNPASFRIINSKTLKETQGFVDLIGTKIGYGGRVLPASYICDETRFHRAVLPNGILLLFNPKKTELSIVGGEDALEITRISLPQLKDKKVSIAPLISDPNKAQITVPGQKPYIVSTWGVTAVELLDAFQESPGTKTFSAPLHRLTLSYLGLSTGNKNLPAAPEDKSPSAKGDLKPSQPSGVAAAAPKQEDALDLNRLLAAQGESKSGPAKETKQFGSGFGSMFVVAGAGSGSSSSAAAMDTARGSISSHDLAAQFLGQSPAKQAKVSAAQTTVTKEQYIEQALSRALEGGDEELVRALLASMDAPQATQGKRSLR